MTCDDAREAMMTAEPRELLGRGRGALAEHIAGCPVCTKNARVLSSALSPLVVTVNRRSHRRAALVVGIPAAAAAVVLGVFIAQPDDDPVVVQRAAIPANVVSVDVKAGQHATVFKTSDPKVTVVWISPGGSE
ncbi:MAG TPA: hypothetical protein VGP95_22275 [Gemmatimonadaceae bacterium]|nr:hypothetical protein [Gemmatimonadaceae bacterium]